MPASNVPTRRFRRFFSALALIAVLFLFSQHYLGLSTTKIFPNNTPSEHPATASTSCAAHGYSPFTTRPNERNRLVYDLMMVNTELDFLEIRLNTLYDDVDYFVVVESPKTFQMGAKPLHLKQNWERFKKYHDKIIYHQLQIPDGFKPSRTWDVEEFQRNAMYDQVLPSLVGAKAPIYGDVILVSDVDEIPRPETIKVLRSCEFPVRLTLNSRFYYYSFEFLHDGSEWAHPQATFYRGKDDTIRPSHLRNGNGGIPILREFQKGVFKNSSWHCSSCFSTVAEFLNKMGSFSHLWMNGKQYRDPDKIADAVKHGKDLWGRSRDTFHKVENNQDLPNYKPSS